MSEEVDYGAEPAHMDPVEPVEFVEVYPEDGKQAETAQALLDAADEAEERPEVVAWEDDHFRVPAHIADVAGLATGKPSEGAYSDLTKAQLQDEANGRGLSTGGTKAELAARLEADDAGETGE